MNSQDALKWNQLILSAIDGTISPDDFARLDNEIRTNLDLANHYVEFMLLYAGLRQPGQVSTFFSESGVKSDSGLDMELWNELATFEKTAETVERTLPSQSEVLDTPPSGRIERKISRMAIYTSMISVAALVLMGLFVFLNPRTKDPVGILVKTVDSKWHDNTEDIGAGQDLYKGRLHLDSGLAQVRFASGASVILEGPAEVELLGGNSMNVLSGKIVATVGREAIGFVVNTPRGKVLDLGTEFGIQVNQTGQSQVHVFTGEVVLYPMDNDGHLNVSQGSAKSVDQDGKVADIPLGADAFVRQEEMDSKLLAASGDSYYRWKASIFDLHRDPSLVAHYFDVKDNSQSGRLLNTASNGQGRLAGNFGTQGRTLPTWVTGRWSQKAAVRFERGKNQAIVIGADPVLSINGPITISAWVYYPDEKKKGGHLISARDDYHVNFQFSVFDRNYIYDYQKNKFEFLRFNQKKEGGSYSREFVQRAGAWYHLAVTHDMQNVYFYVNGQLFETIPNPVHPDFKASEIVLGSMKLGGKYVLPEGDFDGVVDELLIFNRCLGDEEIQNIYKNGLPVSTVKP
jgi:hypothetical protein